MAPRVGTHGTTPIMPEKGARRASTAVVEGLVPISKRKKNLLLLAHGEASQTEDHQGDEGDVLQNQGSVRHGHPLPARPQPNA